MVGTHLRRIFLGASLLISSAALAEASVSAGSIHLGMKGETKSLSGDGENFGFRVAFRQAND